MRYTTTPLMCTQPLQVYADAWEGPRPAVVITHRDGRATLSCTIGPKDLRSAGIDLLAMEDVPVLEVSPSCESPNGKDAGPDGRLTKTAIETGHQIAQHEDREAGRCFAVVPTIAWRPGKAAS